MSADAPKSQFESFQPTSVLVGQELSKQLEMSLGATLENQPGVASRSFGPAPARPVVRGLDGDRVLILQDGQRMGDLSSQSGDHGVSINPAAAQRIEVVRGPATLLYGATLGAIATSSENFVFAPGLVFVRSDVSDYGSMLGISMPFEWVTARGMRFGLELDLGRSFGGTVRNRTCVSQVCTEGEMDRPAGRAFALRFQMGFGFNRGQ